MSGDKIVARCRCGAAWTAEDIARGRPCENGCPIPKEGDGLASEKAKRHAERRNVTITPSEIDRLWNALLIGREHFSTCPLAKRGAGDHAASLEEMNGGLALLERLAAEADRQEGTPG